MHTLSSADYKVLAVCAASIEDLVKGTITVEDVAYLLEKLEITLTDIRLIATTAEDALLFPHTYSEGEQLELLRRLKERDI